MLWSCKGGSSEESSVMVAALSVVVCDGEQGVALDELVVYAYNCYGVTILFDTVDEHQRSFDLPIPLHGRMAVPAGRVFLLLVSRGFAQREPPVELTVGQVSALVHLDRASPIEGRVVRGSKAAVQPGTHLVCATRTDDPIGLEILSYTTEGGLFSLGDAHGLAKYRLTVEVIDDRVVLDNVPGGSTDILLTLPGAAVDESER